MMYSLKSATFVASQLRPLLSVHEQRCLYNLLQQTYAQQNHGGCRFQSSSSAAAAVKVLKQNRSKVISTSAASGQMKGGKGSSLPPYMVFRYCQSTGAGIHQSTATHSTIAYDITHPEAVTQVDTIATRPLVLLFAWMLSRNSHIEKYREFWTRRGYDILTVQTSPLDLLIPSLGGRKVAANVYSFLRNLQPRYDQIIVHAFSVGGYQLGELLQLLYEGIERGEPEAERLYKSMKGWLIDSVVFGDDAAPGLSRAITQHPIGQPIIEKSINAWLTATKPFTYDRYKMVEANIIDNRRHVPAMLLFSKDDVVSNWRSNYGVIDKWTKMGVTNRAMCWDTSKHVLHYKEHPDEYEQVVDSFVEKLNITKASPRD